MSRPIICSLMLACAAFAAPGCELCAIYNADSARDDFAPGLLFTLEELYVSSHTLQFEGNDFSTLPFFSNAHLDSSITHLVPGYSFSSRFGVSLNLPIIYGDFRLTQLSTTAQRIDEQGTISGLGDAALIGRVSVIQKVMMRSALNVNVLAGVKFPTGDTERLDEEVASALNDQAIFGRNHQHGSIGGVHLHDLTLGSGSYDGLFAVTARARRDRWFINGQIQYYLRTEARGYGFGDQIIASGGPGGYALLKQTSTLSLQANGFYESTARDLIVGQTFNQTGMTAWYLGPLLNLTLGEHFVANAGADLPLHIYNHGLQTVPDYRVHGGLTWRF
jgi:hypothetical protein